MTYVNGFLASVRIYIICEKIFSFSMKQQVIAGEKQNAEPPIKILTMEAIDYFLE